MRIFRMLRCFAALLLLLHPFRMEAKVFAGGPAPPGGAAPVVRVGWLEEAGTNAEPVRHAFVQALAQNGAVVPAAGAAFSAVPEGDLAPAAATLANLARQGQVDCILAAGPAALRALAAAGKEGPAAPVVALSPESTAALFPEHKAPPGFLLFSPEFQVRRMRALHAATGFSRLGLIVPPAAASEAVRASFALYRNAANKVGGEAAGFEVFAFEGLAAADASACREAVDFLFFDEIDAIVLDGSGCFDPGRADFTELMELLRQRGILPLSLEDPALAAAGALLAPWEGEAARLGRELALFRRRPPGPVTDFAAAGPGAAGREWNAAPYVGTDQPQFTLNLAVAGAMGFDPPVALLALTRKYIER